MHLALPPPYFSIVSMSEHTIEAKPFIFYLCSFVYASKALLLITTTLSSLLFSSIRQFPAKLLICSSLSSTISFLLNLILLITSFLSD